METMMENAAKGQRKALETLYENNKKKVFYIARKLLLNDRQAGEAFTAVFDELWSEVAASKIATEKEFADKALEKTAAYCKKMMQKSDAKAFRIPQNKNFKLTFADISPDSGDKETFVLRQLPKLHRFIFVLHTAAGFDCAQTADALKFKEGLVRLALDVEKENIDGLIAAANGTESYEQLKNALAGGIENAVVWEEADKQVMAAIDAIAKPAEQKQKKKNRIFGASALAVLFCVLAVAVMCTVFLKNGGSGESETDSENAGLTFDDEDTEAENVESGTKEQAGSLDETLTYYADIDIQDYGKITVKLDQKSAPISTQNFVNLANSGFYDGLTFHRIIEGFMMQGGDPDGNGFGGSDQTIVGEFEQNGYDNPLSHTRGAISMARSNDFDSASSQFFIVHQDSTSLDGQYAVFGYVTEGMDVVDTICETAEPTDSNGTIPAEAQPVISSITIRTE